MSAFKLKQTISPYSCDHTIGIRVRIECEATQGLSSKIFAYLPGGEGSGHFNHVCNVIDMKVCPEDEPSSGEWPKWYRLNYIDIIVPKVDMAYDFVEKVKEDIEDLYRNMKLYNQIIDEQTYTVPANSTDFDQVSTGGSDGDNNPTG